MKKTEPIVTTTDTVVTKLASEQGDMMDTCISTAVSVILPEEVQAIALQVSQEKREEVNSTLSQIFAGTANWKNTVESIAVSGPTDTLNMNVAKTARIGIKNARLEAEKRFDAKRSEVQSQMLSYQTEDKLWLKAKQTAIILFKELESIAEYKEKTAERYETEQRELRTLERMNKVSGVNPDITRQEVEAMSDASFDAFLAGIIKAKEDAEREIARQAEEARQAEIRKERDNNRFKIFSGTGLTYFDGRFIYNDAIFYAYSELCELPDDDFIVKVQEAIDKVAECRASEIKEKERLEILAKEKEKELEAERKKLKEEQDKAEAERKRQAEIIKAEKEKAAAEKAKQDEIIAKQKAELEARQKQEAEARAAEVERLEQEKIAAEIAAKAPKKEKLTKWIDGLILTAPDGLEQDAIVLDILAKFGGFKSWAIKQVEAL